MLIIDNLEKIQTEYSSYLKDESKLNGTAQKIEGIQSG